MAILLFLVNCVPVFLLPAIAQTGVDTPLDLVIVLDNSGSMHQDPPNRTAETTFGEADLYGLRYEATKMLIDLVSDRDRVGIVHFSDEAHDVTSGLRTIREERDSLKTEIDTIGVSYEPGSLNRDPRPRDEGKRVINDPQAPPGETAYRKAFGTTLGMLGTANTGNRRAVIFLTDGAPSDLNQDPQQLDPDLRQQIQPFNDRNVPIFLMMLKNKNKRAERLIEVTKEVFSDMGPPAITIDNPADIARAFASVLTQLQPGTYLDVLPSSAGSGTNTTLFTARAVPAQDLTQITFIFVSTIANPNFHVQLDSPSTDLSSMDQRESSVFPKYAVFSFEGKAGAIDAQWQFSARAAPATVENFVLIRSRLRMGLRYPTSSDLEDRGMAQDQPLLVGATIDGLDVQQASDVKLRVNLESCPPRSRERQNDRPLVPTNGTGLNATSPPVFWAKIDQSDSPLYITVEYAPAGALALWRCFPVTPVGDVGALQIIEPQAEEVRSDSTFPIRVQLPESVAWERVTALIQEPSEQISSVDLDPKTGVGKSLPVSTGGRYTIRVVGEGSAQDGRRLSLFAEKQHQITGIIQNRQDPVQLSELAVIDQPLEGEITLDAPLLPDTASISFTEQAIQRTDYKPFDATLVDADICGSGVLFDPPVVRCPVKVNIDDNLPEGEYEITVVVNAPEQRLAFSTVRVRFVRPSSSLTFAIPEVLEFRDAVTGNRPSIEQGITVTRVLWDKPLQLSEEVQVTKLTDISTNNEQPPDKVGLRLLPIGSQEGDNYKLVLTPDADLAYGSYEVRAQIETTAEGLTLKPSEIVVRFNKPAVAVEIYPPPALRLQTNLHEVYAYQSHIWGFSFPIWRPRNSMQMQAQVLNAVDLPRALPEPVVSRVTSVEHPEQDIAEEAFLFKWQPDGVVPQRIALYQLRLNLQLMRSLDEGEYDVLVRTSPPIVTPHDLSVRVRVYGWGELGRLALVYSLIGLGLGWACNKLRRIFTRQFEGVLRIGTYSFPLSGSGDQQLVWIKDKRQFATRSMTPTHPPNVQVLATIVCLNRDRIELRFRNPRIRPIQLRLGGKPHKLKKGPISYIRPRMMKQVKKRK